MDYTPPSIFASKLKNNNQMKQLFIIPVLLLSVNLMAQNKSTNMENVSIKPRTMSCKLTSPELQERKITIIANLKAQILEKKEIDNGYTYKFSGTDAIIDELSQFIKTERKCCSFFDFTIEIEGVEDGNIWLAITGPEGVKDFIKEDLDL